jgi:hypothetical protein
MHGRRCKRRVVGVDVRAADGAHERARDFEDEHSPGLGRNARESRRTRLESFVVQRGFARRAVLVRQRIKGVPNTFVSGGNAKVRLRVRVPTSLPTRGAILTFDVPIGI